MEPSWSQIILGTAIAVLAIGSLSFSIIRDNRNLSRLLNLMCDELDLARERVRSVPRASNTYEVASGTRQGIPVCVHFEPRTGESQQEQLTRVDLVWPRLVLWEGVTIDRLEMSELSALEKRFPRLAQPLISFGDRNMDHPWFGRCRVVGSDADLERVFNPQVQALLDQLGRNIAIVTLYDQTLKIHWHGLEEDPAVVERAFRIGIEVLSLLCPLPKATGRQVVAGH